eukprot:1114137-Rhodomonas_salina.1
MQTDGPERYATRAIYGVVVALKRLEAAYAGTRQYHTSRREREAREGVLYVLRHQHREPHVKAGILRLVPFRTSVPDIV